MIRTLIGKEFGRLRVIRLDHINKYEQTMWLCRCKCGNEHIVNASNLVSHTTKGCGCLQKGPPIIHGHNRLGKVSPTYKSWYAMLQRCYNPKQLSYKNYGGRGLTVCKRWRHSFINFLKDMGEKPIGLSLDRINNDGNYEPTNCRWATRKQQNNNTRRNIWKR